MEFRILGRLEVAVGNEAVPLGGPRQRTVLAHLLLRRNRPVSQERLIDDVWGEDPPPAARSSLQSYVSHLRSALGPERLEGGSRGYLLNVAPEELDASRFEALVRGAGHQAVTDSAAALAGYEEALGLWRGPALDDLAGQPSLQPEIARLEELRLAATEERIAMELALGRHGELVPELQALVGRHPLRERLWGRLMIALYGSGRQAEALEAYGRARELLVEELGLEPSPELQRLQGQILRQHPALDLGGAARPARLEAALVGREPELAPLSEALEALLDGRGGVVSITGEPGIGKSRLVAEVQRRFDGRIRFLSGHAVSYAETIPYWPVREQLRAWLGLGASDPEAQVRLKLRAQLARTISTEADEAHPFLATLLGLALEPEQEQRIADLAPDAVQQETFYWLYKLICALARERPLCLVFEDLHWSDEATLSLLDELLPATEETAVAFLLVHRSDPDHPARQLVERARRRFRLFCELELGPLPDEDARALAEAGVGGELPEELSQLLAERVGGNPYFIGEVIRDLRERGALEWDDGRVRLVGEASIPAALQEALRARLDRLDAEARELITTASVIGRSFDLPLLERLLPRARLLPTLSELQSLQLVVEERNLPAPEYRFRHGIVEEVAYGKLLETRRRELHLQVGEALVELHRDSPAEVYGLLARHFAEADEPERAVEYLLKAADAARAVYAEDEAIQLYRRVLRFMDRAGDEARARRMLLKVALTHHLAFDYRAANQAFSEAFARPIAAPEPLAPSERIVWATPAGWPLETAPGLTLGDIPNWVARNLFRGLVAIGPDFELEPDLAERFTVSDDGCSYWFTLRGDARWSDGAPVTANDFAFTFAQMVEDEVASASWLEGISASALDERTLEIRLREPRNQFLYLLGNPFLFAWPQHVYERRGRDWYRDVPLVGNGPYVLTSRPARADARTPGRVTLESAPRWYGARGNVGEVTIALEPSPSAAGERWRAGEFDLMYEFLAALAGTAPGDQTIAQRAPGGSTHFLGLDARRSPLDDDGVRRALAHAIDRHGLPRALGSTPAVTGGILPPAMPGHSHRVAPAFDLDRARALLNEAGHADGRGLDEVVLAHFGIEEELASVVAAQLTAVGFRIRRQPVHSTAALIAAAREGANAYLWAWSYSVLDPGDGFLEPLLRWGTHFYRDARLERLLARASAVRDQDERLRICREFERIWIGEQAAVVPLAYSDRLVWRRPWVTGMWANAIARSTFADALVQRPGSDARP
ncbi:MAG: ABC transporter substrate-binding protein [Gaiellaceae bacterium]